LAGNLVCALTTENNNTNDNDKIDFFISSFNFIG
jgi:hypothetical protein